MYLYKALYVSFLCMDSGPHQNINFFQIQQIAQSYCPPEFYFLIYLCMCVISVINHRPLSLEIFVSL